MDLLTVVLLSSIVGLMRNAYLEQLLQKYVMWDLNVGGMIEL
jgi:hypothetical protein